MQAPAFTLLSTHQGRCRRWPHPRVAPYPTYSEPRTPTVPTSGPVRLVASPAFAIMGATAATTTTTTTTAATTESARALFARSGFVDRQGASFQIGPIHFFDSDPGPFLVSHGDKG